MPNFLKTLTDRFFSPGALVIVSLAVLSSLVVILLPVEKPEGIQYWVFSSHHGEARVEDIAEWNRSHPDKPVVMKLMHMAAIERGMLSGFLSGTPLADIIESNHDVYPKAFLGPLDQIGFLDLTDRLHDEGLYEQFNAPSFSTMTSRGRIFGLPKDVHPVLLGYHVDLVEEAGIDVNEIETWEDYFRVMRPLMVDRDGDGRPDRYLLNLSETDTELLLLLMMQNDGVFFDENDVPIFANERNARSLATIITWLTGPDRVAAPVTSGPSGFRQHLDAFVVGNLFPDWVYGDWKINNPAMAGRIRLMPLPAWEPGGRRTSVMGGSNIGINKHSPYVEESWEIAKMLYTSARGAEKIWQTTNILSPVKTLWDEPFYHEPDPFVGGQRAGTLYIEQAPHVPERPSSPYKNTAFGQVSAAAIALRAYAEQNSIYEVDRLIPEALRLLKERESALKRLISRNVFQEGYLDQ
ncbi:hypothetical protein AXK12_07740 [Cephaloticoccus capnophilus]|uniref:ABC transporter substrate-binding protein n=1 Tax=Cephaloticoccus capnophilus TaxID=1548208 RepID=A0A139SI47_9BACT|nr:extracellular solute-binding protein [Cephaloticoccus capnophilus]KXU34164.1 hypothetical protein AXK12_07740 [Cephaloticoccus capnophilus]